MEHLPDYDLRCGVYPRVCLRYMNSICYTSELDDVVMDFVAGMICSDESDIEQLMEVLNAYVPQLGEIEG